ncbi:hypothetical protein [Nitrososphaeria virus YSH_1032793]|uniref:Uncharacterized protein n=1 Tax=Nitrososphaeria virus YSH_1032793 TaxID=3071320 RepID=A0A976UB00_9CAUD|nr:hypothetical protein QKV91_gp08 [Yangshan Harbor Nitrososphaeria virus]UVF62212.1 hypothetical protein [Nitrososphaeria virus YSH_1032793]
MSSIIQSKELDISKCPRLGCPNYLTEHELNRISKNGRRNKYNFCKYCRSVWLRRSFRINCVFCKIVFTPTHYTSTSCVKCRTSASRSLRHIRRKYGQPHVPKTKLLLDVLATGEKFSAKTIMEKTGFQKSSIRQVISQLRKKGYKIQCESNPMYFIPK